VNESFFIPGPAGRLEAILMLPATPPFAAAVVCHADPGQGGMMHFKVVFRAAKALQRAGVAALRFNFRGVGLSEGKHGGGRGEQEDARAALDEMEKRFPDLPLLLGGFSFGSAVASHLAAADRRVRALFLLGLPESRMDGLAHLASMSCPRLLGQGEADVFGSSRRIREIAGSLPEPRTVVVVPGADHFFSGHLDALQEAIGAWVASRPWLDGTTGGLAS
jgi:alpha/beta superfamily hydrolase